MESRRFDPVLGALVGDMDAAGLALRVKRVERDVQIFRVRFAGADGAADLVRGRRCDGTPPSRSSPMLASRFAVSGARPP